MSKGDFSVQSSRIRKSFATKGLVAHVPNLISMYRNSYENDFLQINCVNGELREKKGLQAVLSSIFPITDNSSYSLEFVKYSLERKTDSISDCKRNGKTYAISLWVTLRIVLWDLIEGSDEKDIKGVKDQEVFMCEIPMMTPNSTFVVNGIERAVVSQMHRSPGVFFFHDDGKTNSFSKLLYFSRIIPYRGSWLDFEFDIRDLLFFRVDKKRKMLVTSLFLALGMNRQEIIDFFYKKIECISCDNGFKVDLSIFGNSVRRIGFDVLDANTGDIILNKGNKITPTLLKKFKTNGIKDIIIPQEFLYDRYLAEDVIDSETGEVIANITEALTEDFFSKISKISHVVQKISVIEYPANSDAYIRNSLVLDKNLDQASALIEIFKTLRPGESATKESGEYLLKSLFFTPERYDLSTVGRIKMNHRLYKNTDKNSACLDFEDIKYTVKTLIDIKDGFGNVDDIDHLGNRRVRAVGELVENQFRIGFSKVERIIKEKIAMVDMDNIMPQDLLNTKILSSAIKEFFNLSQFSQFMDQTNPLSEITHIRRLSALGPGGVSRERVGFEVRDVHPTHYGRICPIETPEGQSIGLINSLASYARINRYGFIESPYRVVKDGYITDEIRYLSASEEERYKIAQYNVLSNSEGKIVESDVNCRTNSGDFIICSPVEVDFIDLSPMQVVSVAASLIPFLENDDANRALMGSNMQRQAVPLISPDAPVVGTGIERNVAMDSGAVLLSTINGIVEFVDSTHIIVRSTDDGEEMVKIYSLKKYEKSNHNTCITQKAVVNKGDIVTKGSLLADGQSTEKGEIALGKNVLVAFMSWNGYNFEDSIIVSERVLRKDYFTSIHIEEFEIIARDTRLGPEEITRDMPNVGEENLRHLDESGIIYIGSQVKPGDILVGKVTPKSETAVTPEEKLLRAIFGEKAAEVKDSSLYVPPGVYGVVVDVKVFSRRGTEKDERSLSIDQEEIDKLIVEKNREQSMIDSITKARLIGLFLGEKSETKNNFVNKGDVFSQEILEKISLSAFWKLEMSDKNKMEFLKKIEDKYFENFSNINQRLEKKIKKIRQGDDLPQGTLKIAKVFVANKYKIQPGDKMSGRHGNKGVISKIVPEEDMPFLDDGTVVDIILNPLGIPSRMNVGQILETHLGWAAKNLAKKINKKLSDYRTNKGIIDTVQEFVKTLYEGNEQITTQLNNFSDEEFLNFCKNFDKFFYFATAVFDGAKISDIKKMLKLSDQDSSGQIFLRDGRTGLCFDRKVTIGYKYLLKLHHLVDDKIHARSIGPYSLVTQQPLGGKSHFGGQRFGEMECWALQAYGASYTLQEMLTIKSDDVVGRIKTYESIVKGDKNFESGIPESFNVMIKELRSLCLNVQLSVIS
ncbi:MAG: DNA-directed RNA polymerase subunit beta [Rickettsia sp.]|nr:DNA-directed RNA polymerase subunit beta [Rickettsia sp.]